MQAYSQIPLFPKTKRCNRCGETLPIDRFGKDRGLLKPVCKPCNVANAQAWYRKNTERKAQYDRERRITHADSLRASRAQYRRDHKTEIAERNRAYRERLGDELREKKRIRAAYVRKYNPRQEYDRVLRWFKRNPEAVAARHAKRRAWKLNAGGSFTAQQFKDLVRVYGGRCLACGVGGRMSVDHVVPLSKGGTNGIENIQPLCRTCNHRKNTRTVDYRCSAFAAILRREAASNDCGPRNP